MNERIKELAIKTIANVRFWNAEKEAYDVSHDELIEFAELIVKECVNVVKEHYDDTLPWGGVEDALEHFGVEE